VGRKDGHWTLRLEPNVAMLFVWTAVLALAWRMSPLHPYGFLAAGTLFGAFGAIPGPLSAWAAFKLVREAITLIPTANLAKRLRAPGDGPDR
jgi:hypothetical protein